VQAPRRPHRDVTALRVCRWRDAEKTDLRGIWAPAGLDVAHWRAATAKMVGKAPEAQLLLSVVHEPDDLVDWWEAEGGRGSGRRGRGSCGEEDLGGRSG
jgi:hypothetical protein